jgi:hypothetical protein
MHPHMTFSGTYQNICDNIFGDVMTTTQLLLSKNLREPHGTATLACKFSWDGGSLSPAKCATIDTGRETPLLDSVLFLELTKFTKGFSALFAQGKWDTSMRRSVHWHCHQRSNWRSKVARREKSGAITPLSSSLDLVLTGDLTRTQKSRDEKEKKNDDCSSPGSSRDLHLTTPSSRPSRSRSKHALKTENLATKLAYVSRTCQGCAATWRGCGHLHRATPELCQTAAPPAATDDATTTTKTTTLAVT